LFGAIGARLTRPNNETTRKTILVEGDAEEGHDSMGFFTRRLTTISIVYDFNNLGAALLARLYTFSVVNRATKSVFMGKRRQVQYDRGLSPFLAFSPASLASRFFARRGAERRGNHRPASRPKRSAKGAGIDPLSCLLTTDRCPGLSHENPPPPCIFTRVYTRARARLGAICIH